MIKVAFAFLLVAHGLLHLLGASKAFGWATVGAIRHPITKLEGVAWLVTSVLFVASAVMISSDVRAWWLVAAPAVILSQIVIGAAWHDARFGTIANLIILVPVILAVADVRPSSLRQTYLREVEGAIAASASSAASDVDVHRERRDVVTDADLQHMPAAVQRYLRNVGVVGKPRLHNVLVRWHGLIRTSPEASWMPFEAEQLNTFAGERSARYFFIESSLYGVPFDGLHIYEHGRATMAVRAVGLVSVADARGPEMDRSETVTLFNDLCVLAPAALIDAPIVWEEVDARSARAVFRNAGHEVRAELVFNDAGDLIDFVSDDRSQTADGKTYRRYPWTTPLSAHRRFEGERVDVRLPSQGDAMWLTPAGPFVYGRFTITDVAYNVRAHERESGGRP